MESPALEVPRKRVARWFVSVVGLGRRLDLPWGAFPALMIQCFCGNPAGVTWAGMGSGSWVVKSVWIKRWGIFWEWGLARYWHSQDVPAAASRLSLSSAPGGHSLAISLGWLQLSCCSRSCSPGFQERGGSRLDSSAQACEQQPAPGTGWEEETRKGLGQSCSHLWGWLGSGSLP